MGTRKCGMEPKSKSEVAIGGDATEYADAEDHSEAAVVGAALQNSPQLLHSMATSSTA